MGYRLQMGKPPQYVASHPGKLSLLPSAGWEMSTSESVMMLCGWEVKAGMADFIFGCTCDGKVKLCAPSLTFVIPECLGDEFTEYKVLY